MKIAPQNQSNSRTPSIIQGIVKYFTFMMEHNALRLKLEYLHDFYIKCESNKVASAICYRWINLFTKVTVVFTLVISFTGLAFMSTPMLTYWLTGVVEPVIPLYLPYVDETTTVGFCQLFVMHVLILVIGVIGMICADLTFFLTISHICPMTDVLVSKLNELEERLKDADRNYGLVTRNYLFNIVRMHQQICAFLSEMSSMLYAVFIFEVVLNSITLCSVLLATFLMTYIPLYFMIVMYTTKLFVGCAVGTMVEIYVSVRLCHCCTIHST